LSKRTSALRRPIAIFDQDEKGVPIPDQHLLTLHTLADVRLLVKRVPRQRRLEVTWQHVEACLKSGDAQDVTVALQIVLQLERVPYTSPAARETARCLMPARTHRD
jgi:hypothetical protein